MAIVAGNFGIGSAVGANFVLNVPAGISVGDLLIAALCNYYTGDVISTPAGWTDISPSQPSAPYPVSKVFTRVAGGSEPSTYSFPVNNGDSNTTGGAMQAFSGNTVAVDVIGTYGVTDSGVPLVMPAITVGHAGTLVSIGFVKAAGSAGTLGVPSGFTSLLDVLNTGGGTTMGTKLCSKTNASTGTTGTVSQTAVTYSSGILLQLYESGSVTTGTIATVEQSDVNAAIGSEAVFGNIASTDANDVNLATNDQRITLYFGATSAFNGVTNVNSAEATQADGLSVFRSLTETGGHTYISLLQNGFYVKNVGAAASFDAGTSPDVNGIASPYWLSTGKGAPGDTGIFVDPPVPYVAHSCQTIVGKTGGGEFNMMSAYLGPVPGHATNGTTMINVFGYQGATKIVSQLVTVVGNIFTNVPLVGFLNVDSVVFENAGFENNNQVQGGASNSPGYMLSWIEITVASGFIANTEQSDVNTGAGTVGATGTIATSEASDVNAASGTAINIGTLVSTEQNDINVSIGTLGNPGTIATIEQNDVNAASGTVVNIGNIAVPEQSDVNAASGVLTVSGTSATTEASDINVALGSVVAGTSGTIATVEQSDVNAATGGISGVNVMGDITTTEQSDVNDARGNGGTSFIPGNTRVFIL